MTEQLTWTIELVRERLYEALRTLRRSIPAAFGPNSRKLTSWPSAPDAPEEAYGYTEETVTLVRPGRDEISRMDEAMGWIAQWLSQPSCLDAGLPPDAGWLALQRARGVSWKAIGRAREARFSHAIPGGNHPNSLRKIEERTHEYLVGLLVSTGIIPRRPSERDVVRGEDRNPGALPRAMDTVRPVRNPEPCSTCRSYVQARKPRSAGTGRCGWLKIAVAGAMHAYAPPGAPCWAAPEGTDQDPA